MMSPTQPSSKSGAYVGEDCRACGRTPAHECRMISDDDAQVEIWRERGLIDFPLDSPLNTIHLCPDCEAQFDTPGGGFGFILIPEDMYFFTRYEVEDDYRRTRIIDTPGTDILPPRPPPTAELYRAHQNGVVGGRYRRVFLNGSPSYAQEEDISTPKEWSGAPIAALRRAMQAFGTLYMIEIGNEAHYTLCWLRGLYVYNDKNLGEYLSICQEERYKIYGRPAKVDQQSSSDSTSDSPGGLPGGDLPGNSSSDKRSEHSSAASEPEKLDDQSQTTIQECGLGPGPKRGCCSPI